MNFRESKPFAKDVKKLEKKYRSLRGSDGGVGDLGLFRRFIAMRPRGNGNSRFTMLHAVQGDVVIMKARLACRCLRDSSMRIIYAWHKDREEIVFIQLYYKGVSESEDKARIKQYIDSVKRFPGAA